MRKVDGTLLFLTKFRLELIIGFGQITVKLQTPDHVRSVKIVKNPELSWSGNFLVVNIVGPKVMCAGGVLVRKLLILGLAISYTHMNCLCNIFYKTLPR